MNRSLRTVLLPVLSLLLAGMSAGAQESSERDAPPLPADAEGATAALTESPRHGEWVEVDLPDSETKLRTWVSYPERRDEAPVVIVLHEIFGLTDWVRAVADQLAAEGFVAVAPNLLSGKGPDGGGTDSFPGDQVRAAVMGLRGPEIEQRLNALREWAIELPSTTDKTATVGFCWGGSTSFAYATRQPELDAAVVYYGTSPRQARSFEAIEAPVLGLYGEDDARVTSTVEATAQMMQAADKQFTHHIYEGAGHGFLREQIGRDGANEKAARQAWAATIEFLQQHLQKAE